LFFFSGCIVTIIGDVNPTAPDSPSVVKLVSAAVLAVYEVVVRIIPSVKDYSVVSWVIRALKKVSDTLNVRP
jgi:UDP-N-acetylglucosamine enolpyruvyl transferase